jgi:transglutaminase-like putative cysteine protease
MSAGALAARSWLAPARPRPTVDGPSRPVVRLVAFAGLAVYGAMRWGTLLVSPPTGRLLGLVAVAVALGAAGPWLATQSRLLAAVAVVIAGLGMLAVCGLPLTWIRHVRIATSASAIGNGLTALPRLLVPYRGLDASVRMVMLMGAAVLLMDAALMFAFTVPAAASRGRQAETARGSAAAAGSPAAAVSGDLRRAVAALPLVALAAVPLTLVPSGLPYFQGLLLFGLLAGLIWGERLAPGRGAAAVLACSLAAMAGLVVGPALDSHKPWINYQALTGGLDTGAGEQFDWTQRYATLNWPRDGRAVFSVSAPHSDYWKAVNLDTFTGTGWSVAPAPLPQPIDDVSASALSRWTQSLTVSIGTMQTANVIGAGDMAQPTHSTQAMGPGASGGTWVSTSPLGNGDSYTVRVYSPHPSALELDSAGTEYPPNLWAYLALTIPSAANPELSQMVNIPPFGAATQSINTTTGVAGTEVLAHSSYAEAYTLAQRLSDGAATPYAYVARVMSYLGHGYSYDENPPARRYPLEAFLFQDRRGYCQQFAGAMALLLRLGGVPARVAAGFTPGQYDAATHRWVVSDTDAHAWVEAYFPSYGWVRFDPTPGADPALSKTKAAPSTPGRSAVNAPTHHQLPRPVKHTGAASAATPAVRRSGGSDADLLWPLIAVGLVLLVFVAFVTRPLAEPEPDALVAELERAFARAGRPLSPDLTLSELAGRLGGRPEASAYVSSLAAARYGTASVAMSGAQRRALRAQLRHGGGLFGALRALWALPPRRSPWRKTAPSEPSAVLH